MTLQIIRQLPLRIAKILRVHHSGCVENSTLHHRELVCLRAQQVAASATCDPWPAMPTDARVQPTLAGAVTAGGALKSRTSVLAPFHVICTPMQNMMNADRRISTIVPLVPIRSPSRCA